MRDDLPPKPTCPVCATETGVEREGPGRWLCRGCWTLFTGEQGEWDRTRDMRDTYRRLHPK